MSAVLYRDTCIVCVCMCACVLDCVCFISLMPSDRRGKKYHLLKSFGGSTTIERWQSSENDTVPAKHVRSCKFLQPCLRFPVVTLVTNLEIYILAVVFVYLVFNCLPVLVESLDSSYLLFIVIHTSKRVFYNAETVIRPNPFEGLKYVCDFGNELLW